MLLIDNSQVSVSDFIAAVERISGKKIPLSDIKSNQEFIYNPAKKSFDAGMFRKNGVRVAKMPASDDVLASFNIFDDNEGRSVTFRFASRSPYTNPKNPNALVHDPKAIDISGNIFTYEPRDLEKVIYLYCHPACYDSPFYKQGVYKYTHNNLKAASKKKRFELEEKQRAYQHASNVDDSELKVLVKGLKLPIIPNADADDLRTVLIEYALNNPKSYLEKTDTEVVKFEGMIQEAIDTGFISYKKIGPVTTYSFGQGRKKGEQITNIMDNKVDPVLQLKSYMKNNIAQYYTDLVQFNQDDNANSTAEKFLQEVKNGADPKEFLPYKEEVSIDDVVDFKTAQKYLKDAHRDGKNPSPANTKAFLEEVSAGNILSGNVSEFVGKYINQS